MIIIGRVGNWMRRIVQTMWEILFLLQKSFYLKAGEFTVGIPRLM
jgi:hypothetical protein